jgi:hypothetical protein
MIVGAALAALVIVGAPPGTDFAAHAYQSAIFGRHGLELWDNYWYAGRYAFVTYSVLYYPLAALLGMAVVAIASVGLSVGAFAAVLEHEWGTPGRWAARTFTIVWPAFLLTATFPFTLGALFALLAFRALQCARVAVACALCALALAASPLSFALLALVLAGTAVSKRPKGRALLMPALTLLALGALELLLWRMFPGADRNPFPVGDMLAAVAFCAVVVLLTRGIERAGTLRWVFVAYGLATLGAYVIPSAVGQGISRFQFFALPIAVLAFSLGGGGAHRRGLVWIAVPLAAWINVPPLMSSLVSGARSNASNAAYWQPATAFLRAHGRPSYRVEAVDTVGHWPAVYLAQAGIPLARGWFRQDDFPQNTVFYRPLDAGAYATWLQLMGVRYVVLSDATPDYSARREALLLRSGRSGLALVQRTAHLSIYEVRSPRPMVVGAHRARVVSLAQDGVTVSLAGPGTYRLAIRYTPYWRPTAGCVSRATDGMTILGVRRGGRVRLHFDWSARRALDTLVGAARPACRADGQPATDQS